MSVSFLCSQVIVYTFGKRLACAAIVRAAIRDVKREAGRNGRKPSGMPWCRDMFPLGLLVATYGTVCECNYRTEMTALNVGRLAGLGVVDAPKFPVNSVCGNVPKSPVGRGVSVCKLTGLADTTSLLLQRQTVTSPAAVRIECASLSLPNQEIGGLPRAWRAFCRGNWRTAFLNQI